MENDYREVHQEHEQVDIPKNRNLVMTRPMSADYMHLSTTFERTLQDLRVPWP